MLRSASPNGVCRKVKFIQGSARAVPRYPWVPGYRPVPIEILKIWVPLGTGYRENLRNWVPLGTGYRANFKRWVPLGTGYQANFRNWVPLGTGKIFIHADPWLIQRFLNCKNSNSARGYFQVRVKSDLYLS